MPGLVRRQTRQPGSFPLTFVLSQRLGCGFGAQHTPAVHLLFALVSLRALSPQASRPSRTSMEQAFAFLFRCSRSVREPADFASSRLESRTSERLVRGVARLFVLFGMTSR
ncbi:hypothetical protein VFPBJ_02053 [Purpureocillium lilacinum]|uniref:Uncharacterized protein n=1 Tax=Purpureocillium lilacinum TaxID=33203 RepID=A0A179HDH0_PURLI|nr:hypothetical protein VFPBJ_02053 [Purpureocillium lilacinum]